MTWVVWRQHRAEALAMTLLIALFGGVLIVIGKDMHAGFVRSGAANCLAQTDPHNPFSPACLSMIGQFQNDFSYTTVFLPVLYLVPVVIGAFLGAPLVARELESGTWQLAWTQAVPRLRWLAYKLAALVALTLLLHAALTALVTWYLQPWDALQGRFMNGFFDFQGLTMPAYALFAFAVGTAAGALIQRSVPALATAFAMFAVVRYSVEALLRPHYQTALTAVLTPGAPSGAYASGGWVLSSTMIDANGNTLPPAERSALVNNAVLSKTDQSTYLRTHGIRFVNIYQPADRFWTFQLIEAGIYLGIVAVLLALVVWRVRRRLA
jgi:hypothetical protein